MEFFNSLDTLDLFLLLSTVVNSFILLFTLVSSKKSLTNISFIGITLGLLLWVISNFQIDREPTEDLVVFWAKLSAIGILIFTTCFIYFAYRFPDDRKINNLYYYTLVFTPAICFGILSSFTELVITGANLRVFPVEIFHGPLYLPMVIWMAFVVVMGCYILIRKYYVTKEALFKLQLRFLIVAFLGAISVALFTNLFLPLLDINALTRIGPSSMVLVSAVSTYLIFRRKFLDTRLLIGRTVYYILTGSIAYLAFYVTYIIDNIIFDTAISASAALINALIAILFVVAYDLTQKFIKNIESNIVNPGYEPNSEIATLNLKLSGTLDFHEIMKKALSTFSKTIRPNSTVILVKSKNTIETFQGRNKTFDTKKSNSFFYTIEDIEKDILLTDEIEVEIEKEKNNLSNKGDIGKKQAIYAILRKFEAEVVMKIKNQNGELMAILILGEKDGDVPYNDQEISFIQSLNNTVKSALARSFLYEEVKQFNETLQAKVDEATKELEIRNEQLAEQLRKERDMMDILGHELRTPLGTARNAIVMMETLNEQDKLEEEKLDKYLKIAIDNIRREKDLLETILQSARLENSRLQISLEKLDLNEVIENTVTSFEDQAKEKGLDFIVKSKPGTYVSVDKTAIQQVVDNLVSNAVKYTYEGSVQIIVEEKEDKIKFSVVDTGEGIKDEDMEHIGKKFFRANTHLDSAGTIGGRKIVRPGGTGIGLYVIKGLLEQMDSNLEIDSEFGKGSTFSFELDKFDPKKGILKDPSKSKKEKSSFSKSGNPNEGSGSPEEKTHTPQSLHTTLQSSL